MHDYSSFVDLLRDRAQSHPDRLAFSFLQDGETETARLTYGQLDQQARAIATQLIARGISGQRALLLYGPNLDFVTGFFGCLYANVTAVPAYPPRSAQMLSRLTSIIQDAEAAIALTSAALLDNIEMRLGECETPFAGACLATDEIEVHHASNWTPANASRDDLAFLQYTSGSTGNPKGVMVSHGNLLHNSKLIQTCFEDVPDSLGVSWLPPYHDMGLVGGILQPLFVGSTMILMPPVTFLQRPYRWLDAISRFGGTTSGGPNFAYELCVKQIKPAQIDSLDLSRWTLAFTGAEPVRAETIDAFCETFGPCGFQREAFLPCYGMAETTLIVTGVQKKSAPLFKTFEEEGLGLNRAIEAEANSETKSLPTRTLVGSGIPVQDLKVAVVDPERRIRLGPNQIGEVWVAGASVTQGYWNQTDLTQATFEAQLSAPHLETAPLESAPSEKAPLEQAPLKTSETYLRTGDLGFFHEDQLFIAGRLKDLIIIRGRNHYPQDIEATVQNAHPDLRTGCVAAFLLTRTPKKSSLSLFKKLSDRPCDASMLMRLQPRFVRQ